MIPTDHPFFLFVGPTKSGTTWIHRYLESRGDVAMPVDNKETFFFDKLYSRGFAWYAGLFPEASDSRIRVEVAPSYFHKPEAQKRVAQHLPHAQVIVMVRDPRDRAISHYFHYRKRGDSACRLTEMVKRHSDVVEAGMYERHSRAWESLFKRESVHYLEFKQLVDDPDAFCRELCGILGIPFIPVEDVMVNRSVNSATLPRSLVAARATQAATTFLRRRGLHNVVRVLKHTPIKKWLFAGGANFQAEKRNIQTQVNELPGTLHDDWESFLNGTRRSSRREYCSADFK